jgi:hypothetical protein
MKIPWTRAEPHGTGHHSPFGKTRSQHAAIKSEPPETSTQRSIP